MELLWVNGYCGVEENEISNILIEESSTSPMQGLEPAIQVSVALANDAIKNCGQPSHNGRW